MTTTVVVTATAMTALWFRKVRRHRHHSIDQIRTEQIRDSEEEQPLIYYIIEIQPAIEEERRRDW